MWRAILNSALTASLQSPASVNVVFGQLAKKIKENRFKLAVLALVLAVAAVALIGWEFKSSYFQASYFSRVGRELTYTVKAGASERIRFPTQGPFDIRLGYTRIPGILREMTGQRRSVFRIAQQAEISPRLAELIDNGVFPIYQEKVQAGLQILDRDEKRIHSVTRPERIFRQFDDIPPLVRNTLLFIENREILDQQYPYRNPAVEWDRLTRALLEKAVQLFVPSHTAPGGSTVATQLEKYRHGHEGRTRNVQDKFQQMLSASYRAYLNGRETFETRKQIVLNYINSIPLAALPGYGEVNGLGDGLWAWYRVDSAEMARSLQDIPLEMPSDPEQRLRLARTYKQVLSLFIAHRRPSYYLMPGAAALDDLTNSYLDLMADNGVIPAWLRDTAARLKLKVQSSAPPPAPISFVEKKAANAIRTRLLSVLKYRQLYDMDQIDLTVRTPLDLEVNRAVSTTLQSLMDKKTVQRYGLGGEHTLGEGDPAKVLYSVTLFERVGTMNLLRVQTDNLDRPFDINEGTKLDLGSTAKLRVTTNYLEIIARLFEELRTLKADALRKLLRNRPDELTRWVSQHLLENSQATLNDLLNAALERTYSANPGEQFFTGGGLHTFANFKREDNGKIVTIRDALRHSINLPFIRLMRDIVRYYMAQLSAQGDDAAAHESRRKQYLAKFADKEGSYFLQQFYQKYRGRPPSEILGIFLKGHRMTAKRLAVIARHIWPKMEFEQFVGFIQNQGVRLGLNEKAARTLYESYAPGRFSLNDQGYLARVHPLELWLVGYLLEHPKATFAEAQRASIAQRQEVYEWLFKKSKRRAQDTRIKILIETEAFLEIHRAWQKVGYPFSYLVPSYASAIGSSGDRPNALAELVGIILNDGVRYPQVRLSSLHFAKNTPFETLLLIQPPAEGERVLRSEVAAVLRAALRDIVENGTARRVKKAFNGPDGKPLVVGGKTGTGDHRFETFGKGGQLLTSRVVNRTATFVFYIGDRFFGTVTAHVEGPQAAKYDFTSALAAELLKILAKSLEPVVHRSLLEKPLVAEVATPTPEPARKSPSATAIPSPASSAPPAPTATSTAAGPQTSEIDTLSTPAADDLDELSNEATPEPTATASDAADNSRDPFA